MPVALYQIPFALLAIFLTAWKILLQDGMRQRMHACILTYTYIYLHIYIYIYICSCMSVSFQFLRCHHPPTNATACSGYFLRRCKWRCRPHACRRSLPHRVSWVTRRVQSPISVLAWEHATLCWRGCFLVTALIFPCLLPQLTQSGDLLTPGMAVFPFCWHY